MIKLKKTSMNKRVKSIMVILVLVFIVGWIFFSSYKTQHLRDNFKITTGKVTGITGTSYRNNNRSIFYDYEIDGMLFHGENNLAPCIKMTGQELRLLLVNQDFPVAYDVSDYNKSEIILRHREAEFYKYQIPVARKSIDSILSCD